MRNANRNVSDRLILKRLAEARMSEHDRQRALRILGEAEAIAKAIIWVKERFASLGALFLKPGFKN